MFVLLGPKGPWGVGGSIKQQQLTDYRSCRWQDAAPGPGTAGASKRGTISSNLEMPLAKPFRQRGSSVIFRFLVYMRFSVPEQNPEFLGGRLDSLGGRLPAFWSGCSFGDIRLWSIWKDVIQSEHE